VLGPASRTTHRTPALAGQNRMTIRKTPPVLHEVVQWSAHRLPELSHASRHHGPDVVGPSQDGLSMPRCVWAWFYFCLLGGTSALGRSSSDGWLWWLFASFLGGWNGPVVVGPSLRTIHGGGAYFP
jgi:hypothetical protein